MKCKTEKNYIIWAAALNYGSDNPKKWHLYSVIEHSMLLNHAKQTFHLMKGKTKNWTGGALLVSCFTCLQKDHSAKNCITKNIQSGKCVDWHPTVWERKHSRVLTEASELHTYACNAAGSTSMLFQTAPTKVKWKTNVDMPEYCWMGKSA